MTITLCVSSACDVQLVRELAANTIKSALLLEQDTEKLPVWQDMLERLPGPQISSAGALMEWNEEFEETEPWHRHFSHLYALYPGDEYASPTPELRRAMMNSIAGRLTDGKANHPLQRAWLPFFYARLGEGDMALAALQDPIAHFDPAKAFRLDILYAVPATAAEMLLRDCNGVLEFLPALPDAWSEGAVKGLLARGSSQVDITWENKKPHYAKIHCTVSGTCRLSVGGKDIWVTNARGEKVELQKEDDMIMFNHGAEEVFTITAGGVS